MANTFNRKFSSNVGNTFVTVGNYTVAANTSAVVIGLNVNNTANTVATANVVLNNGQKDFYLAKNVTLAYGSALSIAGADQKLVLQTGDSIKVSSSSSADVMLTYLEQDSTVGKGSEYEYYTFGPRVQVANAYAYYDTVYDATSDRVVIGYGAYSAGGTPSVIVGEVVNNTVSFGPEINLDVGSTSLMSLALDTTNNRLVAYDPANRVRVGIINAGNNTVSFGDPVEFDTGTIQNSVGMAYDSQNNRIVVAYEKEGGFPRDTYAVVGEVSGLTITFGTPVLVQVDASTLYGPKLEYIPSAQRIAIVYNYYSSGNLIAKIGTVSGNTITFGNAVVVDAGDTYGPAVAVTDTGALAIAYTDYSAAPYPTKIVAGTVSGNTVTFGSNIAAFNYEQSYVGLGYWSGQNKLLVTGVDEATLTFSNIAIIDVSGTTLTVVEDKIFLDGEIDRRSSGVSVGGENNFLLVYNDYNDAYKTKATLLSY